MRKIIQELMEVGKPRRSYIRRKKCLNECMKIIQQTLRQLASLKHIQVSDLVLTEMARKYAEEVEAMCWSPRLHITNEEYQNMTREKTKHVCRVLLTREIKAHMPIQGLEMPFQGPVMMIPPVPLPKPAPARTLPPVPAPPPTAPPPPKIESLVSKPPQQTQSQAFSDLINMDEDPVPPMPYEQQDMDNDGQDLSFVESHDYDDFPSYWGGKPPENASLSFSHKIML